MWFDGIRQPNTIYVASVSRGKDSTAMLRAIQLMGWPLDAIYSVDIWATQDIPAELPPMVAFKEEWDKKVLEWFGVPVTRLCAMKDGKKVSYNDIFYRKISPKRERERERESTAVAVYAEIPQYSDSHLSEAAGANRTSNNRHSRFPKYSMPLVYGRTQESRIYGFQIQKGNWCTSYLKRGAFTLFLSRRGQGA